MKNTFTMQKYIAVALATAMLGSMGVTAFASPVQVSPVKAVSTRMSSSTAAAQEKLKKAEEELKAAQAKLEEAVKEAGLPAGTTAEQAVKSLENRVAQLQTQIEAAGGSSNPEVNNDPTVQAALADWKTKEEAYNTAKADYDTKKAAYDKAKADFDAAEATYNTADSSKKANDAILNGHDALIAAKEGEITTKQGELEAAGDDDKPAIQEALNALIQQKEALETELQGAKDKQAEINAAFTAAETAKTEAQGALTANPEPATTAMDNAKTAMDDAKIAYEEAKQAAENAANTRAASNLDTLIKEQKAASDSLQKIQAAQADVQTKQQAVNDAKKELQGYLKDEKYDVKDIELGEKIEAKVDSDRYLYYLLEVDGFGIMDDASGGFVDYDDVEDIDDLRLNVKITDGSEYVKDYYIDEIDSDSETIGGGDNHRGEYAVIIELKDNNTTKKQKIKGTVTIKNKTKKLDDVDFTYNYDVDAANPDDIDGVGDCEFDGEDVYINLVDFNEKYKVADFKKEVENIELEDNNGFYFEVKASDQGKLNLSYDNEAVKSVVRRAPADADLTFYNFYGYPEFDFTGRVTITPEDDYADEYYLYYIDKNENIRLVNTKLNEDGDALEFKTRTLGRYVLSDTELDTDDLSDENNGGGVSGETTGPVETPSGGTDGGKYNPSTGL